MDWLVAAAADDIASGRIIRRIWIFRECVMLVIADNLECHQDLRRGITRVGRFGQDLGHLSFELLFQLDQSLGIR
jgi:hypothetical protein